MKQERTNLWRWLLRRLLVGGCMTLASLPALAIYPYTAEIVDFSGRWTGKQAEVAWTTGVEYGTAGFRVYRQSGAGEVPLHEGYIPADITRPAGTYTLADAAQKEGGQATYRLEELRGDGQVVSLGVWPVSFKPYEDAPARLAAPLQEALSGAMTAPATGPAVKIPVVSNDIYAVSFASIGAVLQLSEADVAEQAGNAMLAMHDGNSPVAYLVDADRARILFYGWGAESTYTKTNFFWIEPGNGLHIQRTAPEPVPVSSNLTFTSTRPHEADLAIMTERGILRDDLYFWRSFVAGHATNGERTFGVPLDGYAGGDLTLTVHLVGWNDTAQAPDHRADVLINDEFLGSVFFDGKEEARASFTLPAGKVLPAGNILKVRAILQAGHTTSLFVLDRFDVAYTRYYAPVPALLQALDGGNGRLGADRFVSPLVFNVTDPLRPGWIADSSGVVPSGHSWLATAGTQWALRERDAIVVLPAQAGGLGAWMLAVTNAVDYLVIAPRVFAEPANALADYRASQGLRTAVALYEDLCDQFAGGLNSPEAIRALLAYAQQNWASAPWMVVLGGWGHYDYLGATTTIANPLPPLLASDSATLRPADGRFADLTGNEVPDLAIGRIPAQSVTQFNTYIDKLKAYEAGGPQASYGQALFAADNADAGGDFTASNLGIAIETQARYALSFTTLDSNTVAGVRADIRAAFTNRFGMIHYTGHGSYQQLAGENLLHVNDVNAMLNPPVPLFISLTCLIGRFDMLATRSLGETLALRAGGGALAVYAPSGLSWNNYATSFGETFHRIHAGQRCNTIGVALLRTRQSIGELTGQHAVALRTYNLLGDPAMKLRGGEGVVPPSWTDSFAHWRWERFSFEELRDPLISGVTDTRSTVPPYTVALASHPASGGLVSGAGIYDFNAAVTVGAGANPGFVFSRWTAPDGSLVSPDFVLSFNAVSNRLLTARFALLSDVLDAPGVTFSSGGDAPWRHQTAVVHTGTSAAQSGSVGNQQQSWLETTVTGPGVIRFRWKVSSETGGDFLQFRLGTRQRASISGEVGWDFRWFTIPAGTHTLRWVYTKNASVSQGADSGWVDTVSWKRKGARNDFDGDFKSDFGVYSARNAGRWHRILSSAGFREGSFGYPGTVPVVGDWDGDGRDDFGVYDDRSGRWYRILSTAGFRENSFGYPGAVPVVGDWDGDGRDDFGVYDDRSGRWYRILSTAGYREDAFGYPGAVPVIGDWDGDGRDDFGVYDDRSGRWYRVMSTAGFREDALGYPGAVPVIGDWDGDGRDDFGVYDDRSGRWYRILSTKGFRENSFGYPGTVPLGQSR